MNSNLRKLFIGLISLGVVLGVYLLYSRVSETPRIDMSSTGQFTDMVVESNAGDFDGRIGNIGDVEVIALKKTKFLHRNKNKVVDRELGFEELLHEVKEGWDVSKPYLNVYQPSFNCYITAEEGRVRVETAAGRHSPKDATFTGNVVAHILPAAGSSVKECFIYLEDVAFNSEKSLFSTAGPVRFVSQDVHMLGTGLKLIYNGELDRLELFRMIHLENLSLRNTQKPFLSSVVKKTDEPTDTASPTETQQLNQSDDSKKTAQVPTATQPKAKQGQGNYYKCVFSKNVVIDTPEQLVFASEDISISDIFLAKGSTSKSIEAETAGANDLDVPNIPVTQHSTLNESSDEQFVNTLVTCDDGVTVMPMSTAGAQRDSNELNAEVTAPDSKSPKDFDDVAGRSTFIARNIDYSLPLGDAVAKGPLELTFYSENVSNTEPNDNLMPVKVTAQKEARFLSASNQVIFEGDCLCTMLQNDPNIQQKYTLSAPQLTVTLGVNIEHLTAGGGTVKLATIKKAEKELVGGFELECHQFDYDDGQQLLSATGPGMIRLNNAKAPETDEQVEKSSLSQPCYAFLRDYETLEYFLETGQIIADAEPQGTLRFDYIPVVEGQLGQQVIATASHAEANLVQTPDGQLELSTLTASGIITGGITHKDEDNQFIGSKLFCDHSKYLVKIWGDQSQPCYFNGAPVDGVEIDLKTGKRKILITGPSAL